MENNIIWAFWVFFKAYWKEIKKGPLANNIKQNYQREGAEADNQEGCANSTYVTLGTGLTFSHMTRSIPF